MSFSELFDNEFKQRNKGHFSAIVRVAFADGKINDEEQSFLDKLASRLEISEEEYKEILTDPWKHPINPPYLYAQRVERLYDLARMVHVDHHLGDQQEVMLKRMGLALGFTPGNVDYIVSKALNLVDKKVDLDTFSFEMENMNK
ncbi:TerB family tellurite resistance protein [Flavobacterium reichenbachii]|uniref:Fructose 1,6-bisphosphatase n=1 Tax=Flavobacterium reichenbachii TaxID=362418 RepID=A0A085ZKI0_9FLAO|nr:TerB family tellurite resistance protein [Flavobacterium reichenbachii]KFF04944.1 fructose 1,6-bisphosphatase [Flavobacterium reichenbachii]OXB15438.1 fructose 1,6-bisphosphatase [Flavobacterium reichenbachii]